MKFVVGAMKFFGKKDGQTCQDFADECRKLTPQDKAELAPALTDALRGKGDLHDGETVEAN